MEIVEANEGEGIKGKGEEVAHGEAVSEELLGERVALARLAFLCFAT